MAVLETRLRESGRVVFSFNLGTLNIWDIRRSAFVIHRKIESLAEQVGIDKVDVVAHSMGGLIALYYVKRLGGAKRVRKLIMMGTPHRGTWGALLGVLSLGLISSSTWQLLPESLFLRDLAEGPLPAGVEYYSIWAEFDWLCPPSSARLPGAKEISVPLGHSSLVMSETVFRRIHRALSE
jgi:triacylglycerol esterase/lipase EstA (alpha/beta hydrolase family)